MFQECNEINQIEFMHLEWKIYNQFLFDNLIAGKTNE